MLSALSPTCMCVYGPTLLRITRTVATDWSSLLHMCVFSFSFFPFSHHHFPFFSSSFFTISYFPFFFSPFCRLPFFLQISDIYLISLWFPAAPFRFMWLILGFLLLLSPYFSLFFTSSHFNHGLPSDCHISSAWYSLIVNQRLTICCDRNFGWPTKNEKSLISK